MQIQIRNEQAPKKAEIYDRVIKLFFDALFAKKVEKEIKTEQQMINEIADFIPDLTLWASDEVLKSFISLRLSQVSGKKINNQSSTPVFLFSEMLVAMRKDLGHSNKNIDKRTILGIVVNDVENLPDQ